MKPCSAAARHFQSLTALVFTAHRIPPSTHLEQNGTRCEVSAALWDNRDMTALTARDVSGSKMRRCKNRFGLTFLDQKQ